MLLPTEPDVYQQRQAFYQQLEASRQSKVILYVTGDRRQLETQIAKDAGDLLIHHLDLIQHAPKITLYLYTIGGDVLASWSVANLIRQFCDQFEVIVVSKALSGGTLICLGADTIVMTKQAVLGPIDPSTNSPLNPQVPGAPPHVRAPVSVEAIQGYLDFAKQTFGRFRSSKEAFLKLTESIHPHVLGQAFRSRSQIRMLGEKLLSTRKRATTKSRPTATSAAATVMHPVADPAADRILRFLCSESGSHDYTITRQEAREMGLPIETPTDSLYAQIRDIYQDFATELDLQSPYDPNVLVAGMNAAAYNFRRALIESVAGGSHVYISEGSLSRQQVQTQPGVFQNVITDNRTFEGWRHFP